MSQVIIWHKGKYYNRVEYTGDGCCNTCAAADDEPLCMVLAGVNPPITCSAFGKGAFNFDSPLFAYHFKEVV